MVIFILAISIVFAIRLPVVQTYIVNKASVYLAKELQTNVSIERIEIEFTTTVKIEGLYIEDQHNDTLLYASELNCYIDLFSPFQNIIILSGIDLKNAVFKLQKYPDEDGLNLDFIVQYFSVPQKDEKSKSGFEFNPGELRLTNVVFVYRDNRYHNKVKGIDFTDIRINRIDSDIDNISFTDSGVLFTVENIKFTEKSGFKMEYFESKALISATEMKFEELHIKTPYSSLNGEISFTYTDFNSFNQFISKVDMKSKFDESILSSKDLTYFARDLSGLDQTINFSGKIKGTVEQLKGTGLEIEFADRSKFSGDVRISGLPDFNESFFDIVVDEFRTNKYDLESIPAYPFDSGKRNILPENIATLGTIKFKGKFTGFLTDFVAFGSLQTSIGYISSDINLKIGDNIKNSSYSGHLSAIEFDLGKFALDTITLGTTSFKAEVKGEGLDLESVNANLDANISNFGLKDYNYKNINIKGEIAKQLFNGQLEIKEENIELNFLGEIDLSTEIPTYNFDADIKNVSLAKLNLINRDTSSTLHTTAQIRLTGKDIDDLTGSIHLYNTTYTEGDNKLYMDTLKFLSYVESGMQKASLNSELLDFTLAGKYKRTSIFNEIDKLIRAYFPGDETRPGAKDDVMDIEYAFTFKKTENVLKLFYPDFYICPQTKLNGSARSLPRGFKINLISDSIRYKKVLFSGINISSKTSGPLLSFVNQFGLINVNDTLNLYNVNLEGKTDKYKSLITLSTFAKDSSNNYATITAEANYLNSGQTLLKFKPSDILIDNAQWNFSSVNSILIDTSFIDINNFELVSEKEKIRLNGTISAKKEDQLNIKLVNFNTSVLNPALALVRFEMSGIASGTADISGVLETPGINSQMYIEGLGIYGDTLGDATINFGFDTQTNIITSNALVDKGGIKNIEVEGKYFILPIQDSLDFNITLQKSGLEAFAHYAKGIVSDVRGNGSGKIRVHGPVDKIAIDGKLRLQKTSFVIDYLNTRYSLSEEVEFNNKYFHFKNFTINDENGSQAKLDGFVYHDHLKDFSLQLDIKANNFQMLNTTFAQNELYYGTAYGTGSVKINGPLSMINISIGVKTERNTEIFIPLSNPEEISESSFINFISKDSTLVVDIEDEVKLEGIKMDFELDVTNDAEIQLIFDSKIGDIIKGRGNGNIRMEINTLGDFWMFGNYEVVSGDYLFTLQNLINKRFVINPGGTIRWSGSPYDATIDIEGVYKLKASLYDLLQDTTLTDRVPVEVHLKLKESLFNPNIDFDIIITDMDPTMSAVINRYISTEEEKSTQTMSLLVLNRFAKAPDVSYQGSSQSGVSANAAEILSQQLSVWASQISDVVDFGVNYRAGDAFSQEEFEVAISTQILNNRVTLDGNVGVAGGNSNNTSNIVGDFNAEVKVSNDGRFRFRVFNKTINNNILNNYNSPYTQGAGILYREEFDTVGELYQRFRNHFRKNEAD